VVRHSIGTDFAMNFARTAYCARQPLTRQALGRAIAYLNAVNDGARERGYSWDAYTNNCSHVVHNAVAAAGVWDPKEPRSPVPMLWDKEEKFRKLTRTPPSTVTELYANLTHFRDRYVEALATQSTSSGDTFSERFRERLTEELQRTESLIAEYRLLVGARSR